MKTVINRNAAAYLLAVRIDCFAEEFDTYDYYDVVEDRRAVIIDLANALLSNSKYLEGVRDYLKGIIEDDRGYAGKAVDLLRQIDEFIASDLL